MYFGAFFTTVFHNRRYRDDESGSPSIQEPPGICLTLPSACFSFDVIIIIIVYTCTSSSNRSLRHHHLNMFIIATLTYTSWSRKLVCHYRICVIVRCHIVKWTYTSSSCETFVIATKMRTSLWMWNVDAIVKISIIN